MDTHLRIMSTLLPLLRPRLPRRPATLCIRHITHSNNGRLRHLLSTVRLHLLHPRLIATGVTTLRKGIILRMHRAAATCKPNTILLRLHTGRPLRLLPPPHYLHMNALQLRPPAP